MKKLLFGLTILLIFGFVSSAAAYTIEDVGGLDLLLGYTTLGNSGADTEAQWINSVVGPGTVDSNIIEANKVEFTDWTTAQYEQYFQEVTGGVANQYAFELPDANSFFLIKTGNQKDADNNILPDTWLFDNVDSTLFGTFINGYTYTLPDNTTVTFTLKNIEKISHISKTAPAPVPEPSTILLLGGGLLGLGIYGRKRGKK